MGSQLLGLLPKSYRCFWVKACISGNTYAKEICLLLVAAAQLQRSHITKQGRPVGTTPSEQQPGERAAKSYQYISAKLISTMLADGVCHFVADHESELVVRKR